MFNKDLFYELCEKYNVELSNQYGKPMIQTKDNVREITDEDVRNIVPRFQEYFSYSSSYGVDRQIEAAFYVPDELLIAC